MTNNWQILAPTQSTCPAWQAMRQALWPQVTEEENLEETQAMMTQDSRFFVRIAWNAENRGAAFADAFLDHDDSHRMHKGLGFAETERVVYFRKDLA